MVKGVRGKLGRAPTTTMKSRRKNNNGWMSKVVGRSRPVNGKRAGTGLTIPKNVSDRARTQYRKNQERRIVNLPKRMEKGDIRVS